MRFPNNPGEHWTIENIKMAPHYAPQISVVIPSFRPNPVLLREALSSVINQTLDTELFEIIVVDDASDDDEALGIVNELNSQYSEEGPSIRFIKHSENQWLAAARTTGANASEAPFIVFLDDDDLLSEGYLEKCLLLLQASPEHDWVYTSHRKFGQRNELRQAAGFSALKFFFRNSMSYSSMFRREAWLKVGQRQQTVTGNIRQFEDWDMYIRMMSMGMIGTPLRDTLFHYRKSTAGLAARSIREYILSVYQIQRQHFFRLLRLPIASVRHRRLKRLGHARASLLHPVRYVNMFLRFLARKFMGVSDAPVSLDAKSVLLAVFSPGKFAERLLNDTALMSLAAARSGFDGAIGMDFTRSRRFPVSGKKNGVLAAHIWWQMGGAENIYWYWLKACRLAGAEKIINLVSFNDAESGVLKVEFSKVSDIQYDLSAFGETPEQRLRVAWNLIDMERPRLIFISSNSYLYQLTPHIKREFPETKIIDILHNEYDGLIDWYTTSADYADFIDKRIVTSNYWKDVLIDKYKVAAEKIVVSRNPVNTTLYDPELFDRKVILKSYKLDPKKITVAFIGRLHPQKGMDVFLALAELMATNQRFQFVVTGDGELRPAMEKSAKRHENLVYLGYMASVERVLAMTDVLICPSLYEGAPLIGLEAAAMNTTVIAPNLVGFKEQIEEGKFGRLYDASMHLSEDIYTLQDLLETDTRKLLALGANGRDFVLQHHSFDVVKHQYAAELKEFFDA